MVRYSVTELTSSGLHFDLLGLSAFNLGQHNLVSYSCSSEVCLGIVIDDCCLQSEHWNGYPIALRVQLDWCIISVVVVDVYVQLELAQNMMNGARSGYYEPIDMDAVDLVLTESPRISRLQHARQTKFPALSNTKCTTLVSESLGWCDLNFVHNGHTFFMTTVSPFERRVISQEEKFF